MSENKKFAKLNGFPASPVEVKSRREHTKSIIVSHPRYQKIMNRIEELHFYSSGSLQAETLFLYGETGVGKSTVLEEYTERFQREIIDGITIVPILYNKVPVGATPKSVASSLLSSLGDPAYDKGTEISQTDRLLHFIKVCKVELIIIDEFQHLIDRDTRTVLRKASEWIKKFSDDANVPIILCGMPESKRIFEHNEQLDRRFLDKEEIYGFQYITKEEQIEFRTFLKAVDEDLPFYNRTYLADKKLSDKMFYATNGNPYYVNKILVEATAFAAKSGSDSIDENHLYEAFRRIKNSKRPFVTNPFTNDKFNLFDAFELEQNKNKKLAKNIG
ncbi:TniB family NTP-binding protein [Ferdinandcohnia sp. SAFN-114]|uniref:TniB family NTP-binding protein n=1 Tax=Ferdinandcohnia sp. SAFN-114 TaxID=3387275 RepID=UPI003F812BD2